jgi:hypothetical protein
MKRASHVGCMRVMRASIEHWWQWLPHWSMVNGFPIDHWWQNTGILCTLITFLVVCIHTPISFSQILPYDIGELHITVDSIQNFSQLLSRAEHFVLLSASLL